MELQQLIEAMHQFVHDQGWYERGSPRPQTLRNLAISLNLESAEVLEHFQWKDDLDNPEKLAEELADVGLYLLQIASLSGINLEHAILAKLERNYKRTWDDEENSRDQGSSATRKGEEK